MTSVVTEKGKTMSEEAIYKLHRYPSGKLEEFEYVQELIRCKECKRFGDEGWCFWRDVAIKDDDFCSYGEREDE